MLVVVATMEMVEEAIVNEELILVIIKMFRLNKNLIITKTVRFDHYSTHSFSSFHFTLSLTLSYSLQQPSTLN